MSKVTVSLGAGSRIRIENVKTSRVFDIGSFDHVEDPKKGERVTKHFKDENGEPSSLHIKDVVEFNTENGIDRHNLEMLKLFLSLNPQYKDELVISDPMAEADEEEERLAFSFRIEQYIRSIKTDSIALGALYRRVLGYSASGLTDKIVFNALISAARDTPDVFVYKGSLIYEDASYEVIALVDVAVEKGFLTRNLDGSINHRDGKVFADSLEKAVYLLENDDSFRVGLKKLVGFVDGEQPLSTERAAYVPVVETHELVQLKEESDTVKVDTSDKATRSELNVEFESKTVIPLLKEKGFLKSSGKGFQTRYEFYDVPGIAYTIKELVEFFKKNPSRFEDLKSKVGR